MIKILDPCLALHMEPKELLSLTQFLLKKLEELSLSPKTVHEDFHLSLCYLKGEFSLKTLLKRAEDLRGQNFSIRALGLKVLRSPNSSLRFLALDVELDEVLREMVFELNALKGAVKFQEGFRSHISFMSFLGSELSQEEEDALAEVLEMQTLGLLSDIKIEIKSARIFSSDKKPLVDL